MERLCQVLHFLNSGINTPLRFHIQLATWRVFNPYLAVKSITAEYQSIFGSKLQLPNINPYSAVKSNWRLIVMNDKLLTICLQCMKYIFSHYYPVLFNFYFVKRMKLHWNMYCRGINRKYPLAGDGSWKIWRSYSALGEYGLWKNLKFGSASPRRISNFSITHILQVQNMRPYFP